MGVLSPHGCLPSAALTSCEIPETALRTSDTRYSSDKEEINFRAPRDRHERRTDRTPRNGRTATRFTFLPSAESSVDAPTNRREIPAVPNAAGAPPSRAAITTRQARPMTSINVEYISEDRPHGAIFRFEELA
jgi:hypothetical protein